MAYKPTYPDLTHLGSRDAATRFAKKNQKRRKWKNRGYIYNGRLITPEGSKDHSIWRDIPDRNERFQRIVERTGKPGRQLESQYRRETNKKIAKSKYTDLTPAEKIVLAKQTQAFNEAGLDSEHTYSKETFSEGKVDHPEHRIGLEPEINRSFDHRMEAIERSNYFLEKELANPSASMSTEELLDLVADANPKGPAGRAYADTLYRNIGRERAQFDPEGMRIDHDLAFSGQETPKIHMRDRIEDALSKPFDYDAQGLDKYEYERLGVWHDADTLKDSWIKVSRDLNTDSGTFKDGGWTPAKDPTARATIDIQSDIGQGKGKYSDIVNLKNKFQTIKRTLPPGEYIMHADNYTKAMYYLRAFKDDPWISKSGEQGGQRLPDGEFVKYDTLKLTVPDLETQRQDVLTGKYPDWQKQGVPQTSLTGAKLDDNPLQSVSEIARRNKVQMSTVTSDLGTAMRRAGSVLPFIGAGLDAWDVQQRWEEMIDNPNEGFADYMDKVQFGLASATLGTSFWAEPANFILGMTNLGIDVARTIAEEDKRNNFVKNMRAIGRGTTYAAQQLL